MKQVSMFIFLSVILSLFALPLHASENSALLPSKDYIIGDGDILYVSVWKDQTMTRQLTVLPGGKISFPLVGELMAGGKTLAQIQSELNSKISRFVPEPNLTVEVQAVNSLCIYVLGEVNRPGRFPLNTQIDLLQSLAMAGGMNSFAKRSKIKVFRGNGREKQTFIFNYDEVVDGKNPDQNILLERGDVIVVP